MTQRRHISSEVRYKSGKWRVLKSKKKMPNTACDQLVRASNTSGRKKLRTNN